MSMWGTQNRGAGRLCGASISGRGAVSLEHGAGLPAGDGHESNLSTTVGEPLVGKGVPELVRVQPRETRLGAALLSVYAVHSRHPLSTRRSGGPIQGAAAVGEVDGLAVVDASVEAVPQQLHPPVAKCPQGRVVRLPLGD
jgi:hypothetical protein